LIAPRPASPQVLAWLDEGKDVRFGEWNLREVECLNTWCVWFDRGLTGV
jgi:hypothetical protein